MPIRKVLEMNGGRTGGVTLPKEELEADGVMTDGELDGDTYACVVKTEPGTCRVQLVDETDLAAPPNT